MMIQVTQEPDTRRDKMKPPMKLPIKDKLILDETVAEQAILFPTDLGLLDEARELSE